LKSNSNIEGRKLLVLDTSYSLEAIIERGLQDSVTCRDLGGFFKHVWTVHPFATLVTSAKWDKKYGSAKTYSIAPAHTFIEGKIGRYSFLGFIPPLNFIVGQIDLLISLVRLVRKEKITVIRAGDVLYLGLLGWVLAKICKIPLLVRVGGNNDKVFATTGQPLEKRLFISRKIEKLVERFVLKRADLVAGANKDNLNFAIKNGARPEYATIFRYGNLIFKDHFLEPASRANAELLKEFNLTPKKFLLYIGRLEKVKHPDDVIKVLAEVRKRGHDVKTVLAGDGRLKNELEKLAMDLGVADLVILCGNRNQEWLSQIIPLAGVIVSPHTGRALSEAALGAVPIVAYDIDWQGELIETGVTGELVPYLDLSKMVDAVDKFLSDPEYSKHIGEKLRKRAIEMMWPETLDQHERDQYTLLFDRFYKDQAPLQHLATS